MQPRIFQVESEHQRALLAAFITRQPVPFQCEIGPLHKQRTLPANRRLWLLHTAASEVTGYSPEEMHELALCRHFGFTEVERPNLLSPGMTEIRRVPLKRSSTRDTKEFGEFMEATEIWYGQELGCWLPGDQE